MNLATSSSFPAGLRVLIVDDDPTCLLVLEKMLRTCLYEATKCNRAEVALSMLRENKNGFDIVISDVHMPDMDGFKLLEHVGLEMDLPVIMMSADDSKSVVMKGVTHGACDYLIKPIRIEALKNIWQHVIRRKKIEGKELEQTKIVEEGDHGQPKQAEDADNSSAANEESWKSAKRRKDEEDEEDDKDDNALKKPRVVWSVELHQQFVAAVNQLGIDKAVPKKILELMNVPGLSRENVASHLQKYRLYLRRLSGPHHQANLSNPFIDSQDSSFRAMSLLNGMVDYPTLAAAGQLPGQSLATLQAAGFCRPNVNSTLPVSIVDQTNFFSFENPNISFGESQQQNLSANKQMNLLHGVPTNMEPTQLASLHHPAQSLGSMNMQMDAHGVQGGQNSNSLLMQPTQLASLHHPAQSLGSMNMQMDAHGVQGGQNSNSLLMQPTQLASLHHPAQSLGSMNMQMDAHGVQGGQNSNSLLMQMGPIQSTGQFINDSTGTPVPRGPPSIGQPILSSAFAGGSQTLPMVNLPMNQTTEFPGNNFSIGNSPGLSNITQNGSYQENINSQIEESAGLVPSYETFNDLQQHKTPDWDLQNIGMSFGASQHSNSQQDNMDAFPVDHSRSVKDGRISDTSFFPEDYGQEDLMTAFLKQLAMYLPFAEIFDFSSAIIIEAHVFVNIAFCWNFLDINNAD
ncbi:hypothetical protein ACFE04_005863 [Oxalis oulophora]